MIQFNYEIVSSSSIKSNRAIGENCWSCDQQNRSCQHSRRSFDKGVYNIKGIQIQYYEQNNMFYTTFKGTIQCWGIGMTTTKRMKLSPKIGGFVQGNIHNSHHFTAIPNNNWCAINCMCVCLLDYARLRFTPINLKRYWSDEWWRLWSNSR